MFNTQEVKIYIISLFRIVNLITRFQFRSEREIYCDSGAFIVQTEIVLC